MDGETLLLRMKNVSAIQRFLSVDGRRLVLGSHSSCDVCLPKVSGGIAWRHVEIWRDRFGLWVRDLNTTFGTAVNRLWIDGMLQASLCVGDELWIGGAEMELLPMTTPIPAIDRKRVRVDRSAPVLHPNHPARIRCTQLRPSERQVLLWMTRGYTTNKQIANVLFISENTVRTELSGAFHTLGVHSREECLAWLRYSTLPVTFRGGVSPVAQVSMRNGLVQSVSLRPDRPRERGACGLPAVSLTEGAGGPPAPRLTKGKPISGGPSLLRGIGLSGKGRRLLRRAMTLLELLVVVAIVAILIAILLPAIQHAREAARRTGCRSNLKQLGLALQNYHAAYNCFPPGNHAGWKGSGAVGESGISALAMLLPYLDQRALYNAINFEHPASQGDDLNRPWVRGAPYFGQFVNTTAYFSQVFGFLCPSDSLENYPGHKGVGATSYAGNYSSGYQIAGSNGVLFWSDQGLVRLSGITDGTANTVAMSEWIRGDDDGELLSIRSDVFQLTQDLSQPNQFEQFVETCRSVRANYNTSVGGFRHWSYRGEYWILGDVGRTLYNHVLPPNSTNCTHRGRMFGEFLPGAIGASSWHSGGVHVMACDGSVRCISDAIELRIWRAIATRSGGENPPANSL